jgi:hypothetical protein
MILILCKAFSVLSSNEDLGIDVLSVFSSICRNNKSGVMSLMD